MNNHPYWLTKEELAELGIKHPTIGRKFETDRIEFVTHRYEIVKFDDPQWVIERIV